MWRDAGLHRLGEHGDIKIKLVTLDESELRQAARSDIYMRTFTNLLGEDVGSVDAPTPAVSDPARAAANRGDLPMTPD